MGFNFVNFNQDDQFISGKEWINFISGTSEDGLTKMTITIGTTEATTIQNVMGSSDGILWKNFEDINVGLSSVSSGIFLETPKLFVVFGKFNGLSAYTTGSYDSTSETFGWSQPLAIANIGPVIAYSLSIGNEIFGGNGSRAFKGTYSNGSITWTTSSNSYTYNLLNGAQLSNGTKILFRPNGIGRMQYSTDLANFGTPSFAWDESSIDTSSVGDYNTGISYTFVSGDDFYGVGNSNMNSSTVIIRSDNGVDWKASTITSTSLSMGVVLKNGPAILVFGKKLSDSTVVAYAGYNGSSLSTNNWRTVSLPFNTASNNFSQGSIFDNDVYVAFVSYFATMPPIQAQFLQQPVTITADPSSYSVVYGSNKFQIEATSTNTESSFTYTTYPNNGVISVDSTGIVTPLMANNSPVTVTISQPMTEIYLAGSTEVSITITENTDENKTTIENGNDLEWFVNDTTATYGQITSQTNLIIDSDLIGNGKKQIMSTTNSIILRQ
jgi:hypothetical protein